MTNWTFVLCRVLRVANQTFVLYRECQEQNILTNCTFVLCRVLRVANQTFVLCRVLAVEYTDMLNICIMQSVQLGVASTDKLDICILHIHVTFIINYASYLFLNCQNLRLSTVEPRLGSPADLSQADCPPSSTSIRDGPTMKICKTQHHWMRDRIVRSMIELCRIKEFPELPQCVQVVWQKLMQLSTYGVFRA